MSETVTEAPARVGSDAAAPAAAAGAVTAAASPAGGPPAALARQGEILPPKRRRRGILLPLIVLAALGGGGFYGYRWFTEGRFIVSTDDAYVKADMSTIAAKVSGYVAAVPVINNTSVTKGQVLAVIDDGDYRIAVDTARTRIETQDATIARIARQIAAQDAAVAQAAAQLAAARADATHADVEFTRASDLMRSSFGTQQKLDQARADRDRTRAAVASAEAAVTAATAARDVLSAQRVEAQSTRAELATALDKANRDLAFTTIRAPFDGVVGNKAAQPGEYVQPGTRLLSLVPLDSAYVEANFKETQIGRLKPGQRVRLRADAYGDRTLTGRVESIAPASGAEFSMLPPENATGNFTKVVQRLPVRIAVPHDVAAEGILRPGLSVVVEVETRDAGEPAPSLMSALGLDALGKPHASER